MTLSKEWSSEEDPRLQKADLQLVHKILDLESGRGKDELVSGLILMDKSEQLLKLLHDNGIAIHESGVNNIYTFHNIAISSLARVLRMQIPQIMLIELSKQKYLH